MITSFVCFIRKTISHSLSAQSKGSPYFNTFKTYCELSSVYLLQGICRQLSVIKFVSHFYSKSGKESFN